MPFPWIVAIVLVLAAAGFVLGRGRAMRSAHGDMRRLHSLPAYYGWNVFLFTAVPALLLILVWLLVQPVIVERRVADGLPQTLVGENASLSLVLSDVRRLAEGIDAAVAQGILTADEAGATTLDPATLRGRLGTAGVALGSDVRPEVLSAAQDYRAATGYGTTAMGIVAIGMALGGLAFSLSRTNEEFRARNVVERFVMAMLVLASTLAILTTVGIVLSLVFETANFFRQYPWQSFFFSLTWSPNFHGNSQLGIIPLLWGTLYISFIALLVAVPIGLFAAIYLSEYATPPSAPLPSR